MYAFLVRYALAGFCLVSIASCSLVRAKTETASTETPGSKSLSLNENASNYLSRQKHRFAEVPFEKQAEDMTALITSGDFSAVEKLMQEHIQQQTSTRGGFYYPDAVLREIVNDADSTKMDFLESLNQWINSDPNSSLALIVRANFYYHAAWRARGGEFIRSMPISDREEYTRILKLSFQDLERAAKIEPEHPLMLLTALELGRNVGIKREIFENYFKAITTQVPFIPQAYQIKSTYLEPQWHGSERELLAFARESSKKAPRGSVIPLIVSQSHRALNHIYPNSRDYYNRQDVWSDIETSFTRIIEDFYDLEG